MREEEAWDNGERSEPNQSKSKEEINKIGTYHC
jgi:hypothetical protein